MHTAHQHSCFMQITFQCIHIVAFAQQVIVTEAFLYQVNAAKSECKCYYKGNTFLVALKCVVLMPNDACYLLLFLM